jgi:hypothetical protein
MSQENIQTDTPQESTNEQQYSSLEEAVFGDINEGSDSVESAFTSGNEGSEEVAAPETGQPAQETTKPVVDNNNDETRYQYWQSQADKLKSENAKLRESMTQQTQAPVQPQAPVQEQVEEFPAPPEKPQRPRNFSREDAYADPNSESARYLDDHDQWRDNMTEYNALKTQYDNAVLQERFDKIEQEKVNNAKRAEAYRVQQQQTNEVKDYVTGHYGFSQEQANDFVQKMSNPESLTVDNLVKLYQLTESGSINNQSPTQPSDSFKQVQNAQQVPSPMGVMPSGNANNDGRSLEDKIMDTMVGNFNNKNPWK